MPFPITNKSGKTIGWEYTYKKHKGIRWLLLSSEASNGFSWQGVAVIINPMALIKGNYIKEHRQESKFFVSTGDTSIDEIYQEIVAGKFHRPSIPADVMLSDKISNRVNRKHFAQIIGSGDYFTLDGARSIVESYYFRREKEDRMLWSLEWIRKCNGIAKAKSKLHGQDLVDLKRSLKDLGSIGVNPVTIPRRWNIEHIPNLLRAYDESIYEEELIPEHEYVVRQHIAEFLSETTSKHRHCAGRCYR